jgi:hypothetical protein
MVKEASVNGAEVLGVAVFLNADGTVLAGNATRSCERALPLPLL